MFISSRYRLVFFHIHKTAGASVTRLLVDLLNEPPNTYAGDTLHNHSKAEDVLNRYPALRDFYKFSIVRNPWDRLVSMYHWVRTGLTVTTPTQQRQRQYLLQFSSFSDYVLALYESFKNHPQYDPTVTSFGRIPGLTSYAAQWPYLYSCSGECLVDYTGRFEELQSSITYVTREVLNLPTAPLLPHANKSSRNPYQDYYEKDTAAMVGQIYRQDAELFGYDFNVKQAAA